VRLADDDMPASSNPALFVTGVNGVDFVQKQIKVTVFNVNQRFSRSRRQMSQQPATRR